MSIKLRKFNDLYGTQVLEQVVSKFTSTTGQSISFIDKDGRWKNSLKLESFTGFCHQVISSEKGYQLCCECNNAFEKANNGRIDISHCHMGVSVVSVPVRTKNNNLLLSYGQFLLEGNKDNFYATLPDNSKRIGIDYNELRQLAEDLRIFNEAELNDRIELLKLFCNYVNVAENEFEARNQYYREYQEKLEIENKLSSLKLESLKTQINQTFVIDALEAIIDVAYKENAEQTSDLLCDLYHILLKCNTLKDSALKPNEGAEFAEEFQRFKTKTSQVCNQFSVLKEIDEETEEYNNISLKAKAIISAQYAETISLETVAKKLYITPSYLSRIFKKETGKNFKRYLIDVRMKEAQRLLKNDGLTVSEVASKVGYNDASFFSKSYKKQFGFTPKKTKKL